MTEAEEPQNNLLASFLGGIEERHPLIDKGVLHAPIELGAEDAALLMRDTQVVAFEKKLTPQVFFNFGYGGETNATIGAGMFLRQLNASAYCFGAIYSAHVTLFMLQKKRYVSPGALLGIHQAQTYSDWTGADDFRLAAESLEYANMFTAQLLAQESVVKETSYWYEMIIGAMNETSNLHYQQIIDYGLAKPMSSLYNR